MWVILSNALIYYSMDECQLYSTLLELKTPWKVEKVSLNSVKKTVEINIAHVKGSKLLCPVCRKECMVYDHLRERIWRDPDSIEFMTFIHASPSRYHAMKMASLRR